jgi:hypothetical protein
LNEAQQNDEYPEECMSELRSTATVDPQPILIGQYDKEADKSKNKCRDHQRSMDHKPDLQVEYFVFRKNKLVISSEQE